MCLQMFPVSDPTIVLTRNSSAVGRQNEHRAAALWAEQLGVKYPDSSSLCAWASLVSPSKETINYGYLDSH